MFSRIYFTAVRAFAGRTVSTSTFVKMPIKVGEKLPSVVLHEGSPEVKVNIKDLFNGKKGILFGLPGAFTPSCSETHIPGYLEEFDKLKASGVDLIVCVSVNDAFVMDAWAKNQKTKGKIRMLADTAAEFSKALDLTIDIKALGGIRSKRYSMLVDDSVVKELNIEPDGLGLTCTQAKHFKF